MTSTLPRILALRSRRSTRFAAAAFALLYAAFASGAAFGPLDLMGLPPATVEDCAKRCCGCGADMHASGECCCAGKPDKEAAAPASGFSWLAAAKCSGATETLAGEMTRVLPHVEPVHAAPTRPVSVEAPESRCLSLVSISSSPPEKVPLAL
ncbi:MAG: hypothetical protein K8T20_08805 [Planctomycetes bacterium]|nr:hypothetical protein [Planctomycetota bacterium]